MNIYEKVTIIKGKKKGPTSMILVGVHGNEICGVKAIQALLPTLKIDAGKLIVAYGNPKAIKKSVRFTEANLNRMFKDNNLLSKKEKGSYEYKRAQFLKKYLNRSDVLLDIHASCTPKSTPFIICEPKASSIVQYLPVRYAVFGFDAVQPGGTDYYMNFIGKTGICIECGYLKSKSSYIHAKKSIYSFLSARGHLKKICKKYRQSYFSMYNMYLSKTNRLKLVKKFKDFEKIQKGQVICKDGTKEVRVDRDCIIMFAQNASKVGEEAFLLGTIIK